MFKTEILERSVNQFGDVLTTPVLNMPRIVLAEFNTHKMISKNSASSRAKPVPVMIKEVLDTPFIPEKWWNNGKGMQPPSEITDSITIETLKQAWLEERDFVVAKAETYNHLNLTKQLANRGLEKFLWHTVLASGTEWENFFALRADPNAQHEIRVIAEMLLAEMNKTAPKLLKGGQWHNPFADSITPMDRIADVDEINEKYRDITQAEYDDYCCKVGIGRSARVSYKTFEGFFDEAADIKLCDNLLKAGHMSPAEHVARAMYEEEYFQHAQVKVVNSDYVEQHSKDFEDKKSVIQTYINNDQLVIIEYGWCGNFRGFKQYRKFLSNENRSDSRLIKYNG